MIHLLFFSGATQADNFVSEVESRAAEKQKEGWVDFAYKQATTIVVVKDSPVTFWRAGAMVQQPANHSPNSDLSDRWQRQTALGNQ